LTAKAVITEFPVSLFSQLVRLKLIKGKFRQDALASTPFVAKSKQQPIKVRSTDTVITYKRCRYYVPLEILGTILLQTGSVLTYLLNCVISIAQVDFSRRCFLFFIYKKLKNSKLHVTSRRLKSSVRVPCQPVKQSLRYSRL